MSRDLPCLRPRSGELRRQCTTAITGRLADGRPVYVAYGEPMRASRLRTFKTHCQEVRGLIDYPITHRADLA
jgi:hypothetical protein